MHALYNDADTEAVLFADASNAFNRLNRAVCTQNVQHICPELAPTIINTHRIPAQLFVGGDVMLSQEGTTQGDPLAMPMYAIGTVPLINAASVSKATQSWYADDSSAGGKLARVKEWWEVLEEKGPRYGYFTNAAKSVLLVKPQFLDEANRLFRDTSIEIRTDGFRHLGAALGNADFCQGCPWEGGQLVPAAPHPG
eukprot:scpid92614/ scgid26199/ 